MTAAFAHDNSCRTCRVGRLIERSRRRRGRQAAIRRLLLIVTVIAAVALANGLLDYGPRP